MVQLPLLQCIPSAPPEAEIRTFLIVALFSVNTGGWPSPSPGQLVPTVMPPQSTVVLVKVAPAVQALPPLVDVELELLLVEELELEEELLDDEELLLEDEVLLEEEVLELELLVLLDEDDPLGIEHSLVPPGTSVPAPKVVSLQVKLPLSTL
jgi:hypothetical protein